jgi:hypothetical protein
MIDHAPDQELLDRLRAADPASSLPPADLGRVAELVEAAMSETGTTSRPTESRETGTHGRSPLTWLVAAAAVILIAAAGVFAFVQHGPDGSAPVAQGTVTRLGVTPGAGRCIAPDVRRLQQQSVAFDGTLVSLVDGTATFDVHHWYAGDATDQVEVTAPSAQLHALTDAVRLDVGHDYLIAATDGAVVTCGLSGPASGALQQLYDRAFS